LLLDWRVTLLVTAWPVEAQRTTSKPTAAIPLQPGRHNSFVMTTPE
jgi:hypothetical protein